ncbi:MAG: peptidoglycan editing factor PgeF [Acidobacteriota bacterium]|nr:peptidoglycan editing factor PgeF [Acidobacteriota bacterium]
MPVVVELSARRRGPLDVFVAEGLDLGVDAFVTGRAGGVSEAPYDTLNLGAHVGDAPANVEENRRRVASAAGVAPDRLVTARQVHGSRVAFVDDPAGEVEADGLVTDDPALAVAVLVADCVPVLLSDGGSRVGVVHAGWRGLAAGVLANAVACFERPDDLRVLLGPSIGSRYQVGPEVASHFEDVEGALTPDVADRSLLDLRIVAAHQLEALGVLDDRIAVTREHSGDAEFFSDRAQRPCGRFALVGRLSIGTP